MQTRNPTFHRRRQERLRREESFRTLNKDRDRALRSLAKGLGDALMASQMQADKARGDGAFAFPAAPISNTH